LLVVVYAGTVTVSNDSGSVTLQADEYVYASSRVSLLKKLHLGGEIELNIPFIIRLPPVPVSPS
jgi:hypothetical protein